MPRRYQTRFWQLQTPDGWGVSDRRVFYIQVAFNLQFFDHNLDDVR